MKIILPIKPVYAGRIFSGAKKWEYRKRIPWCVYDKPIHVFVYVTAPVGEVVGEFETSFWDVAHPELLWHRTNGDRDGGIDYGSYMRYFAGRRIGVAILIRHPYRWPEPRSLSDFGVNRAPQNFCYVR